MISAVTLKIFISSPGDVGEERYVAARVIDRLRAEWAGRVNLEAQFWENEAFAATSTFQAQIPLPSTFDVVVCILWSRLGTRLPADFTRPDGSRYHSGTEFEMEDAARGFREKGRPQLLVYRKERSFEVNRDRRSFELGRDRRAEDERWRQKKLLDDFLDRWFVDYDGSLKAAYHPFPGPAVFEERLETHLRQIVEREWADHGGGEGDAGRPLWTDGSPFRGLRSFEAEHATVFCGRTAHVAAILELLRSQALAGRPFVLVAGRSGSGKSSLLRAGVLPTLTERGVIEGIDGWRLAELVPGTCDGDLAAGLAHALLATGALEEAAGNETSEEELTRLLRDAPVDALPVVRAGLARAAETMRHRFGLESTPRVRLAVLIDPLEELFSDARVLDGERNAFAAALAVLVHSSMVWCLAAVRSDFQARVAAVSPLRDLLAQNGTYELGPPTASEIARIVLQPANLAGLRFDVDPLSRRPLNDVLCDEAAGDAAVLPLLEFTLDELYRRRSPDGVLTYEAYREMGGVKGALARRAEAVFQRLDPTAQQALTGVLAALVTEDEEDDTRLLPRRAPRDEVVASAPAAGTLVEALVGEHLLVADRAGDGTAVLSVADDALLSSWPRAEECLRANRDLLRVRAQLHAGVALWRQQGYLVPPGPLLTESSDLVAAGRLCLGEEATGLLRASQDAAAAGERRRQRRRAMAVAAGILTALAGVLAIYLFFWPHTTCYAGFVNRWGVPEGIGEPLGRGEVRRREWSLCFESRGRLGHVDQVTAVDADRRPTPNHPVGQYIQSWRPKPDFADRVCSWTFTYGAGGVTQERLLNCAGQQVIDLFYKGASDQAEVVAEYSQRGIASAQGVSGVALVRLLRDKDGFDRERRYLDASGVPAATDGGIFGERYEGLSAEAGKPARPAGLAEKVVFLDRRGEPMLGPDGCAQIAIEWTERGQIAHAVCLDVEGRPHEAQLGYTSLDYSYDADGNLAGLAFLNRAGEPIVGLPRIKRTFDWKKKTSTVTYLGANEEPFAFGGFSELRSRVLPAGDDASENKVDEGTSVVVVDYWLAGQQSYDSAGVSQRRSRYAKVGYLVSVSYRDENDEPLLDAAGVAGMEYDREAGRGFREVFVDLAGKPTVGPEGYATVERTWDDDGRLLEEIYGDAEGKLACNGNSYARRRLEYDDRGLPEKELFFDDRDDPTVTVDGYAALHRKFGTGGLLEGEEYLDDHGKRVGGPEGHAVVRYEYDDAARRSEKLFLDARGVADAEPVSARYVYDAQGRRIEERYLDRNGQTVAADGGWAVMRTRYGRGNSVESSRYDAAGQLLDPVVRHEADAFGQVHSETYLDEHDNPTHRGDGVARRDFSYDAWQRVALVTLLDLAGKPVVGAAGYSELELAYDRWGRPVQQRLLAADGGPPAHGLARIDQEFDPWGRPTRVRFLDGGRRPVPYGSGCPELELVYDTHGFPVEVLCLNGSGLPLGGLAGYAGVRILRTSCGRPFAVSVVDQTGREVGPRELPAETTQLLWGGFKKLDSSPLPVDAMAFRALYVLQVAVAVPSASSAARPAQSPVDHQPPTSKRPWSAPQGPTETGRLATGGSPEVPAPGTEPAADLAALTARLLSASEQALEAYEIEMEADGEESGEEVRLYGLLESFKEHADELRSAYQRYAGKDFISRLRGGSTEHARRAARMRDETRTLQGLAASISPQAGSFDAATARAWRDAGSTLARIAARLP